MSLKFPLNICQVSEWLISCNLKFLLDPGLKLRMKSTWKLPIDLFNSNVFFTRFTSSYAYVHLFQSHYHTRKQRRTTFKPRITLNPNTYMRTWIRRRLKETVFWRNITSSKIRKQNLQATIHIDKIVETPVFSLAKSMYGVFPGILGQSISVTYPTRKTFSDHVTRKASATRNNEAWGLSETLTSNGVRSKNKTIQTPPPPPPFEVGCLLFFLQIARTRPQHCMEGVKEGKFYFPFFMSVKRHKGPLGQSVSTNFVVDCRKVYYFSLNKRFVQRNFGCLTSSSGKIQVPLEYLA